MASILTSTKINLHATVHVRKCLFCLVEKVKHYLLREVTLFLVVVHFEDLFKDGRVDGVAIIEITGSSVFELSDSRS